MLRKALQYQRLCGGVIALHEEDPALSGDGVMHEGAVSARLGLAGIPSLSESTMVARDGALAALRGRPRALPAPLAASSRSRRWPPPRQAGARVSGEACPHHLTLTDDVVRTLDSRFKMNPPLRTESDRRALIEALRSGVIDCIATDHAPHARAREGGAVRAGADGHDRPRDGVRGALHRAGAARASSSSTTVIERMTAGGALYGLPTPRIAPRRAGQPVRWSTSTRASRSAPTATPAARRTAASTAARCTAASS